MGFEQGLGSFVPVLDTLYLSRGLGLDGVQLGDEIQCNLGLLVSVASPRAADAPYDPDLDDGVMINSAALWPLLQPQWKDPKKWWKQLATAKGRKDYDWSHLARRYFPERVEEKCTRDPSLGVAHGCFWKYHPARAWAWELRLGREIEPWFTIDEQGSDVYRETFLEENAEDAVKLLEKEVLRRNRKDKDAADIEVCLPVAGVWEILGPDLIEHERELSLKKNIRKIVTFPEPGQGRQAFFRAHPKKAKRHAKTMSTVTGGQTEMF